MKVTVKAVVPHPAAAVFDFVADMRNDEQWIPLVHGVVQVHGDRPGLGATYRFTQRLGRHDIELTSTITKYERPRRLAWSVDHAAMDYRATMGFTPHAKGTKIVQTNVERWRFAPWWLRLLGPGIIRKQLRRQLALLGQALAKERREEENASNHLDSNSA